MTTWSAREAEALATVGLLAAQSDGRRDATEIERLAAVFASFGVIGVGSVHARVALGSAVLEDEARVLAGEPELRQLAWELALGVCHADGQVVERERAFLEQLRHALGLPPESVAASSATAAGNGEKTIREAAVLAGALELLPQGLATLAIVPVQVKLVADVGAAYGHPVDLDHARELLATVGLGLSGQAVEGFARRFFGRLAGRFGGRGAERVVEAATGAAATFAATWAIGQVAVSWYASGRTLDAADLETRFEAGLADGQAAFARLGDAVTERAGTIRLPDLARLVRR